MAETMRAALDDGTGQYVVQDVAMPEMYNGAAMVRVRQTGICGSDLHMTTSRTEAQTMASGHEIAGEIAAGDPGEGPLEHHRADPLEGVGILSGDGPYL